MKKNKPYGTVLIKAAAILDMIAEHPDSTLQEIAQATNMTNSTTLKILDTLNLIGYTQKRKNKTYSLGSKLIRYANKDIEQIDLIELTLPYLEKLQLAVDETIHLGILSNDEIYYINKLEPKNQSIRMSSKIGIARPLYSSAMGKAVLAEYSEEDYQEYLASHELIPYTENTITNSIKLAKEIEKIKQTKISYDNEEMEADIFCIGTALVVDQQIVGTLSVSLPKYRVTKELEENVIQQVLETKNQIETNLKK